MTSKHLSLMSLLILLFAAISHIGYAQDAKSDQVINELTQKIKSAKSIKATFTLQIHKERSGNTGKINGSFVMKGHKYIVSLGSQHIINNGKVVYTYLKDNNEVQISNYSPSADAISPAKLFSGNIASDYSYRYVGEETFNGKKAKVIELYPKRANKIFNKVILYVDKATNFIIGGNVFERNGSYYQYTINSVETTHDYKDSFFEFDQSKYKGVEVIDLR